MKLSYQQVANKPEEFMLLILEGPHVGRDKDLAAEVVCAVVDESNKQGDNGRFHVLSITLARNAIAIRLKLKESQLHDFKRHLEEAKIIFGGLASSVYFRTKYHHVPSVTPK